MIMTKADKYYTKSIYQKINTVEKHFWLDKNKRSFEKDCIDIDKTNIIGSVLSNSTNS